MSKKSVVFFRVATSFFLILSFLVTPVSYVFAQEVKLIPASLQTDDSIPVVKVDSSQKEVDPVKFNETDISSSKDVVPTDTLDEEDQKIYDAEVAALEVKDSKTKTDEKSLAARGGTVSSGSLILNSNSQHETIRPEIDQTTGALVYNYPIETPDGINGINPNLKLSYNSQDTKNDSVFGYGWSSNIPYIERVNKYGTDQLYTGTYDDYVSSTLGELVKDTSTHYVPKSASDIVNLSFSSNIWTYTDKAGNVYTYGATAASRQDNPSNSAHISKWMLSSVVDANGNAINYTYVKDQGQIYPERIAYGLYEISFNLQFRTDPMESYSRGFLTKTRFVFSGVDVRKVTSPTSSSTLTLNAMVVGGGGGGGSTSYRFGGGGGGAGGYLSDTSHAVFPVAYPVVIGAGGSADNKGSSSSFDGLAAFGGGAGAGNGGSGSVSGGNGASGGGAYGPNGSGGAGVAGQGYSGGNGPFMSFYTGGGGGGGSSAAGATSAPSGTSVGGDGTSNSINGTATYYSGGGGGGASWTTGGYSGGQGGGGTGGGPATNGSSGTSNTGGGGGGAGGCNGCSHSGGSGGSGVVVIRYTTSNFGTSTGGTITTSGSETIHTFTSSGTFTLVPLTPSGSTLIKNYSLSYTTGHNNVRAMLASITPSAYDGSSTLTTLPATSFTYNKASSGTAMYNSTSSLSGMFPGAVNNGVVLGDVNGDAYTDIIKSYNYYGYSNVGNYTDQAVYTFNPVTDTYSTSAYSIPSGIVNFIQNAGTKVDGGTRVGDLDGNLAPDLIRTPYDSGSGGMYGYADTEQHNGSGWTHLSSGSPSYYPTFTTNPFYTIFSGDFNGDGLTDYMQDVQAWPATTPTTSLSINNGTSFTTSGSTFTGSHTFNTGGEDSIMFDINGDGLPDIIKAHGLTPCSGPSTYTHEVFINNGVTWVLDASYVLPTNFETYHTGCSSSNRIQMEIADFNNDGLTDIMVPITQSLYINQGKSFSAIGNPGTSFYNYLTSAAAACSNCSNPYLLYDINAEGTPDFVDNAGTYMYPNTIAAPTDLMSTITLPAGGSMAVTYQSSPKYEDGSGNSLNPTMPIFAQTVKSIATTEPVTSTITTTNYEYAGGSYYYNTPFDKKFAGFEKVIEIRPDSTKVINYYQQGNGTNSGLYEYSDNVGKIGHIYRTDILDSGGTMVSRSTTKYGSTNPVTGAYFVYPLQTVTESSGVNTAKEYTYNTTTGNLTDIVDHGIVTVSTPLSFTDTGSDKKTTSYTYATNGSGLYAVSGVSTYDQASTKVNETKYYYDTQSFGVLTDGNNTKIEKLKTGSTFLNTQKTFDTYGNVLTETDERGKVTTYTYDSNNIHVATVTNPLSQVKSYVYEYNTGKPIQITDENGFIYESSYDGFGRVLQQKLPDLTSPTTRVLKTTYNYTDTPSAVAVHKVDYLDGSTTVDSYGYYDGLNRPLQERIEAESGGIFNVHDFKYDSRGNLESKSAMYANSGSSRTSATGISSLYTSYTYDPLDRVLTVIDPIGTTTYVYTGLKTTVTDPRSKVKDYYNDVYGNLIQVDEHNSGSTYTTTYNWDLNGKLLNITDALGNVRDFTYDKLGRRLTADDLHASADTTYGSWSYTYDDAGSMTQSISPDAKTVNYTYDDINRLTSENYTGVAGTEITYTYDSCTNGVGKLCATAMTSGANTAYTYDANGNIASEAKTVNGNTYTTSYTYDRQGNQLVITYPDSAQVRYTFNTAGLLEKVEQKESGGSYANVVSNFDYSPVSTPTTIAYVNGVTTTNTYDATKSYRLSAKTSINGASSNLQNTAYTYDANNNITQMIDASNTDGSKTVTYSYDDLNRMLSATATGVASGQSTYTHTYAYNAIGDITSGPVGTYVYGGSGGSLYANPHAATSINSITNTYDKNGNVLTDGTLTNTWNYKNQLSTSTNGTFSRTYLYDEGSNRVSSSDGTTTTVYPNKFYTYDGTKKTKSIYAGGQLVATVETVGAVITPYYDHTDHLNSIAVVSDSSGASVSLLDYFPFGSQRISSGSYNSTRQYVGERFDSDTSLSYLNARYANTLQGRFISQDPIFWTPENFLNDPQQLNSYSYARNNPITLSDPSGKWFGEYLSGKQSGSDFVGEVGNATLYMGSGWQTAMNNPYVPAIVGAYPLANALTGGSVSTALVGVFGGAGAQYAGDVAGNIADGKTGGSIFNATSNPTQYAISVASVGLTSTLAPKAMPLTIGGISAATSFVQDRAGGRAVTTGSVLGNIVNGVGAMLTEGVIRQANGIPGRLPSNNSVADFVGAHAIANYTKQAISSAGQFVTSAVSSIASKLSGSH